MKNRKLLQVPRFCKGLAAAICMAALSALPARAQMMVVGPDGSISTFAGPVVATPSGIQPLKPAARRNSIDRPGMEAAIRIAASRHQLSPQLVEAVAWQESQMHQEAVSPKGARGVMQLMPDTARILGVDAGNLAGNIDGGSAYLAQLMRRFDGDLIKTLAAYNAGPGAVTQFGGVPPYRETRAYVDAVLDHLAASVDGNFSETRP